MRYYVPGLLLFGIAATWIYFGAGAWAAWVTLTAAVSCGLIYAADRASDWTDDDD